MRATVLVIGFAAALVGCGSGGILSNDCDREGRDTRNAYGDPQEIEKYDSGDYHSHTWWYWSRGFSRNFTWSKDISCRTSDYTFSPIRSRSVVTEGIEEEVRQKSGFPR